MVDTAVAADDHVLEVRLSKPYNALLFTLAVLGIVPEHAYGEDYGSAPIGSGRYMLEQWDKGQQVIFTANPDYYGDKPNMERVVVVFMAEDAAFAAAKSGQVDIAFTYPTYSDQTIDGFELANYKTVDSRGISLPAIASGATKVLEGDIAYNAGNDVTCDIAIRRAINCGIDRSSMVEHVLNGYGHVAYSVGDGMPWSSDDMVVDYNLDRAKQLLDEAGWSAGSDGIRERDGVRAAFDVWYSSDDSARQALANEFCNQVLGWVSRPRREALAGMRSTCTRLNHPCCGAGAPMRRLRCTSCTIPRAGATIPATRARWSTLILTRRWLKPPLRNPIRFGRRPCGMAKRAWPAGRLDLVLDRQRGPSVLETQRPDVANKAAPPRPWLVFGEQRRHLVLVPVDISRPLCPYGPRPLVATGLVLCWEVFETSFIFVIPARRRLKNPLAVGTGPARAAAFIAVVITFLLVACRPSIPCRQMSGKRAYLTMSAGKEAALAERCGALPRSRALCCMGFDALAETWGFSALGHNAPVRVVAEKLSCSIVLLAVAWCISGIAGFCLGVAAGAKRGTAVDTVIKGYCYVLSTSPTFWLGLIALMVFSVQLGWFPLGFSIPIGESSASVSLATDRYHAALPALVLSLTGVASIALHTRGKTIDFLRLITRFALRAGESSWSVLVHHGLRNWPCRPLR